jgi:hypothetical protein
MIMLENITIKQTQWNHYSRPLLMSQKVPYALPTNMHDLSSLPEANTSWILSYLCFYLHSMYIYVSLTYLTFNFWMSYKWYSNICLPLAFFTGFCADWIHSFFCSMFFHYITIPPYSWIYSPNHENVAYF